MEPEIEFRAQVQFDTVTWGQRHIGQPKGYSAIQVELFELFDDPFVQSQFHRRIRLQLEQLQLEISLPTAEDVIVQKLRWPPSKDLDDARDVIAVQGPETLDMPYIENWCDALGSRKRLPDIIRDLPPL